MSSCRSGKWKLLVYINRRTSLSPLSPSSAISRLNHPPFSRSCVIVITRYRLESTDETDTRLYLTVINYIPRYNDKKNKRYMLAGLYS